MLTNAFWHLAHHLPWSITRRFCDMCDEFGVDPKRLAFDMAEEHEHDPRIVGWSCDHLTLTASGGYTGTVSTWCGCDMEPIYDNTFTATA